MSSGSIFTIIRIDVEDKKLIDDVNKAYQYSGWKLKENPNDDGDFLEKRYDEKDLPQFIKSDKYHFIDRFSKEIYDILFESEFNSLFSELKEEFNLNAYSNNNIIEITSVEVDKMLQALNYILGERYDKDIEESVFFDNRYIGVFGDLYAPYHNFKYKAKGDDRWDRWEEVSEENLEYKFMYNRVRDVLRMFNTFNNENGWNDHKYVLLYEVF